MDLLVGLKRAQGCSRKVQFERPGAPGFRRHFVAFAGMRNLLWKYKRAECSFLRN